jgi:hypothetical protein
MMYCEVGSGTVCREVGKNGKLGLEVKDRFLFPTLPLRLREACASVLRR